MNDNKNIRQVPLTIEELDALVAANVFFDNFFSGIYKSLSDEDKVYVDRLIAEMKDKVKIHDSMGNSTR